MKTVFPFIFFNLFIFTTTLTLHSAVSAVVYDSAGNRLLRGVPYYILPLLRGSGGGLTLSRSNKDGCPLNVTQEPFEVNHGVPFTFNTIFLDEDIIRGAYPISIEADVINPCSGSKIWKVTTETTGKKDDDDDDDDEFLTSKKDKDKDKDKKKKDDDKEVVTVQIVSAGGVFNSPESCFQIVENNMMPGLTSYQIQQCPFKCGSSTIYTCYNIGVFTDADGNRYLGRTDAIFPVVFTNSYGTFGQSAAKTSTFSRLSAKMSKFSLADQKNKVQVLKK